MNNLKKMRENTGLTLQQLADSSGSTKSYIWELEKNPSKNPGIKTAYRIAAVLGVSVYDIWPDETEIEVETVEIRRVKPKHIKAKDKE